MKHYFLHRLKQYFLLPLIVLTVVCAMPVAAQAESPESFVKDVSDSAVAFITNKKSSESEKEEKLVQLFNRSVDTKWMGRFAMGRYYRTIDTSQKKRYNTLYHEFVKLNYIPRFREYTGQTMKVLNTKKLAADERLVETQLIPTDGSSPIAVDYRLRKSGKSYKVIDIVGEGISLITTQRSDFGSAISRQGVDSFIDRMDKRVQQMAKAKR